MIPSDFFRNFFWRTVVHAAGGRVGKDVYFGPGVKIYTSPASPVFIGEGSVLEEGAVLSAVKGPIVLGKKVRIGRRSVITARQGIEIGDETVIEAECFAGDFDHIFDNAEKPIASQGFRSAKIQIGSKVRIRAGAKILKGVLIADGREIPSGHVVTKPRAFPVKAENA